MELYRQHRPKDWDEVIGQSAAVKQLRGYCDSGDIPRVLLFAGPTGVGKTSLARILKRKLHCKGTDWKEINCGSVESPIDTVRIIENEMTKSALHGKNRCFLLDECHALTRSKYSQEALLKVLEDGPDRNPNAYFILCTTDPERLIKTIRGRCTQIYLKPLVAADMAVLIDRVLVAERKSTGADVVERIIEAADGSARDALQMLGKVIQHKDAKDQLAAVQAVGAKQQAIELARALINPRGKWETVKGILTGLDGEDPEGLRRMILGYASSVVLNGGGLAGR